MALIRAPKKSNLNSKENLAQDSSGIALFMVISSISVLAILVTEFTYIAQISQSIAYGGLDQTQAHYLAKSGLKLSLLRLKAYQQVKKFADSMSKSMGASGGGGVPGVPRSMIEKIWNFPFFYPIPSNIPGMSPSEKAMVEKFEKDANLEGKFSAVIESESSKYNLNLLLAAYAPNPNPSSLPQGTPSPTPTAGATPTPVPSYSPQEARDSLGEFVDNILRRKFEDDSDFASNYRDFRLEEFMDQVVSWADRTYERRTSSNQDKIPTKRAPFYSVQELHMLPSIDDELYNLLAPNFTVNPTPGININTMQEATLHALIPRMTKEEVKEFFKYRDSEEVDNSFDSLDEFYKYLQKSVGFFKGSQQAIDEFKSSLIKRNIQLVTDESQFKITVRAQVNQAIRTIEAWVTLGEPTVKKMGENPEDGSSRDSSSSSNPAFGYQNGIQKPPKPDSGLKITFMKMK